VWLFQLQNIQDSIAERKDDAVDFKMMGIDHLFVDESHQFKNLMFNTRHDRVSGLGNPDGSQRALNMLFAIRTIQERSGKDLGATFLSGTTLSGLSMGGGAVMDYLWQNYNTDTSYILDTSMRESSPPLEISRRSANTVVVNPLPRLADVLYPLLERQDLWESSNKEIRALSHCLLHFLAQLDRFTGMSAELLVEDELHRQLVQGHFGEEIKSRYGRLSSERKRIVVGFLRRQEESEGCRLYFREAVKALFPAASVYFYKTDRIFLIHLPQTENDADADCMELLRMIFLDVAARQQLYWEHPFGIIGRKPTMRMNYMRLYGARKES